MLRDSKQVIRVPRIHKAGNTCIRDDKLDKIMYDNFVVIYTKPVTHVNYIQRDFRFYIFMFLLFACNSNNSDVEYKDTVCIIGVIVTQCGNTDTGTASKG